MKKVIDDFRKLSATELQQKFDEYKKEYMLLLIQKNSGQGVKTHQFKEIKRNIARIKLVQSEGVNA